MMLKALETLTIGWLPFLEKHLWKFPHLLDQKECLVYGTGYESWGVWAHLNATLFLAETLEEEDALFANSPNIFKTRSQRLEICLAMFRYALGYHTTGPFVGAGGTRWGGEFKRPDEKEGYNNWHSPLWTAFLAEVYFSLQKEVDTPTRIRFEAAVIADAEAQARLDLDNFNGEAEEKNRISHPESNAWKACLLLLARLLQPKHANVVWWEELETRLWASSFAKPSDVFNEEKIGNQKVRELVIGDHMTESDIIVHHGFLHPCYMIFPLFSRLQAKLFSETFKQPVAEVVTFREEAVFRRVMHFVMPGRVIYPAGKDWPRWVYGQNYLLPLLVYKNLTGTEDLQSVVDSLLETRLADFNASPDHSFVIHRFGDLLKNSAWEAHRFESDCASSLALTKKILKKSTIAQKKVEKDIETEVCYEPLAKSLYLRRKDALLSVSTRAYHGPAQITFALEKNPHLLEWRNNGNPYAYRLHGIGAAPRKDVIENEQFKICSNDSFAASYDILHSKEPYKLPSLQMSVAVGALPNKNCMLISQRIKSLCYTAVKKLQMHVWRFSQSPHNGGERRIKWQGQELRVKANEEISVRVESSQVSVDDILFFALPKNQNLSYWNITQNASMHDDGTGASWFEISVDIPVDPAERLSADQLIAQSAVVVSDTPLTTPISVTISDRTTQFDFGAEEKWVLESTPNLYQR